MGFFGELKQDLSHVADSAKEKEAADAQADSLLNDAEIAGLDEAEALSKEEIEEEIPASEEEVDDVSLLLKDLVSDLGGEDLHSAAEAEEESTGDIGDDIDAILAGLSADAESEEAEEASEEELASVESEEEEAPAEEAPETEDYMAALDQAFAALTEKEEEAPAEEEPAEEEIPEEEEEPVEEKTETKETYEYKGADEMETGNYSEETSVITGGMVINGDIESAGSLDLIGKVNGDVSVKGKLNVTGHIVGNSEAKEVFAENAKITGNVTSESSVKIGAGTVVVGNISAFSAAIAGAVKGDIDVHGPVILDSTAIVMGNIRSKSVQINNGAALEGICSQAYAEVSPTAFFDDYKPETRPEKKAKKEN